MADQLLFPDAAQRIMSLIRTTYGDTFKAYFLGVPDDFLIPEAGYPACIVQKTVGTFKVGPTTADDITEQVYIHLIVNNKTGFGAPDSDYTIMRQLQTFVEGRDPTNGYLLPNTLMFALRTNLTLKTTIAPGLVTINNDVHINYDVAERKNMPTTTEAVIDVTVTERQIVLNRR